MYWAVKMDCGGRTLFFLLLLSVALSGANENQSNQTVSSPVENRIDNEHIALAVNEFGYKLTLDIMREGADSNIVISPTGIAGLLAMTLLGSVGTTYDELASTLGFSEDILINRANHEQFGQLLERLNSNSSSRTVYADAIFVDARMQLRDMYREYLKRVYRGDALPTRFSDATQAKDDINEWIKNNTKGKIENFLKDSLPQQTQVVLLSALYFAGQWATPFLPEHTKKLDFKTPTGDVMTDLMLNFGQFKYIFSVQDALHMIALPYNDSTTMYVLKPRFPKRQNLTELMTRLNYTRIDDLIDKMTLSKAVVRFPKMEIKSSEHIEDSLKHLGLKAMFSPRDANFALMLDTHMDVNSTEELIERIESGARGKEIEEELSRLPNPAVYVDTVLHDVKISIDEYGTEAVAATGGFLARTAEQFYADSPFYMFIRNEDTKLVTFSAVINNPNA